MLALELRGEHLLPEPSLRLVHRALVRILHLRLVHRHSLDDNHGHGAEHLLGPGFVEAPRLLVPPASLQGEPVNVRPLPRRSLDLLGLLLGHLGEHNRLV